MLFPTTFHDLPPPPPNHSLHLGGIFKHVQLALYGKFLFLFPHFPFCRYLCNVLCSPPSILCVCFSFILYIHFRFMFSVFPHHVQVSFQQKFYIISYLFMSASSSTICPNPVFPFVYPTHVLYKFAWSVLPGVFHFFWISRVQPQNASRGQHEWNKSTRGAVIDPKAKAVAWISVTRALCNRPPRLFYRTRHSKAGTSHFQSGRSTSVKAKRITMHQPPSDRHRFHCIAMHYIALNYITLHHFILHYATLHHITLHYMTWHDIT